MKKLSLLATILAAALMLSGCGGTHTATNQLIADANANRQAAYGESMVACGDNAACQVGVSMMFASGAGMQQFFKEDSPLDYIKAAGPFLVFGADILHTWRSGTNGDTSGFVVTGDNNQISGFNNKLSADRRSSISASFDTASTIEHSAYNRDYTLGGTTGDIADAGISVEPVVTP